MKILYGVQGTGNGHISRANAMAKAFQAWPEIELTWLLSGRERQKGCGGITEFMWREGLTFVCRDGRVRPLETVRENNLLQFRRDVAALDLAPYDLVISDYEPVIAHAARKRGMPAIGIGHQYAFNWPVPLAGGNAIVNAIMKSFAPVSVPIGLHWHHFGHPIMPPIIDMEIPARLPAVQANKVIVYLPFENARQVLALLRPLRDFEFHFYHPDVSHQDEAHLHLRPVSRTGFKQDLLDAHSVITNSGFELISECLALGKRILTRPLQGQMEQMSNAAALEQLGYASVRSAFDVQILRDWLAAGTPGVKVDFPDVAVALAAWIAGGSRATAAELAAQLWGQTGSPQA